MKRELTQDVQQLIEQIQERTRGFCTARNFPAAFCCRCGYWWMKKVAKPRKCPLCRSKHWATARTNRQGMRPGT